LILAWSNKKQERGWLSEMTASRALALLGTFLAIFCPVLK